MGWQPIETAPKDGKTFVALIPRDYALGRGRSLWKPVECYWERGMNEPRFIWQGWSNGPEPSFWMPLP